MNRLHNKIFWILPIGLLLLNFFAWLIVFNLNRPGQLEVIFFDVGQGDAILIKTPQQHYILIDGGPDSSVLEKMAAQLPFWQKSIDLMVLTHAHDDHLVGLIDVLKRYEVDYILWNGVAGRSSAFEKWQRLIDSSDAEIKISRAGLRLKANEFSLDVLYPFYSLEGLDFQDANLSSIVMRLVFQENSFLFTGDAYQSIERELVRQQEACQKMSRAWCQMMFLQSDVLKVGHHGSKTSTAEEFVRAVSPEMAVISAGQNNRYGHPHRETLATLGNYDITILRTDTAGDIRLVSTGQEIIIANF